MSISVRASPLRGHDGAREEHGRPRGHERDLFLLQRGGLGQHEVGELGRRRHGMGGDRHELEPAQGLHGAARVGIGDEDVDPARVERAHGIGLVRQHGLDDGRVVAGRLPALGPGPQGIAVGADGALLGLGVEAERRVVQQVEVVLEALGRAHAHVAAGPVDIAADGEQAVVGAERLHPGAEGIDAVAADEGGRTVGEQARGGGDVLRRHAADFGGDGGRVARGALGQLVEAVAPAGDESACRKAPPRSAPASWPAPGRRRCRRAAPATGRPSAPRACAWDRPRSFSRRASWRP